MTTTLVDSFIAQSKHIEEAVTSQAFLAAGFASCNENIVATDSGQLVVKAGNNVKACYHGAF